MLFSRVRFSIFGALLAIFATSCSGGGGNAPAVGNLPAAPSLPGASTATHHQTQTVQHSYTLPGQEGFNGSLTLRSNTAAPQVSLSPMMTTNGTSCPTTVTINVVNGRPYPITVDFDTISATFSCTENGLQFGASIFQSFPAPTTISPIKLGDAIANGRFITFNVSETLPDDIVLAKNTSYKIIILPDPTGSGIALPIQTGSNENLTPPGLIHNSTLTFTYNTASGGTIYSAACLNAKNGSALVQALQGIPIVGTPKFYCTLTPANGATFTFGPSIFTVGNPSPDRAVIEIDGSPQTIQCSTADSPTCNIPSFQVGPPTTGGAGVNNTSSPPVVQNFIESNLQDLRLCVAASPGDDCNGVGGNTQGAATTTVSTGQDFEVLVADDPSYSSTQAGVTGPLPWSGNFTLSLSGNCTDDTSTADPSPSPSPEPSPYVDATTNGTAPGPYAEFEIKPTGTGSCAVTVSEDPNNTFTNPARSTTLNLTISDPALTCFSGNTGTCSVSNNVATLSIPGESLSPAAGANAGVRTGPGTWEGLTVSQVTALQFDYTGPTNVGGDPRINLPVTGGTLFVGGNACFVTQEDQTTEFVDAINSTSCNITTPTNSAAGYSTWSALTTAEPNLQILGAPYIIIDEPGTWTISNVLFTHS